MHLLSFSEQIGMIQADSLSLPDLHANVSPNLTQAAHTCQQALAGTHPSTDTISHLLRYYSHVVPGRDALPSDQEWCSKVRGKKN